MAWVRSRQTICSCGTRMEDWKHDRFAYVGQQRQCPGCEVLEQEKENVPEQHRGHTHVYLVPRELAQPPDEV